MAFTYKPTGLKRGAYSNPQAQVNNEFKNFQANQDKLSASTDGFVKGLIDYNIKQRESQEKLFASQNVEQRKMFDKVAGIKETGYGTFDQNMNNFFDSQVEKYFKIKQGMADGKVSQMEGNRTLSYLNNQIDVFKASVIPVMTQAKVLENALKIPPGQPGSVSSRVPTEQQEVLLNLVQGGNVNLVDNNGELVLFKPGSEGVEPAMINVNELMNLESNGIEYVELVPDISKTLKMGYDNVVKPGGKDNADLVMFETKMIGDQEATLKFMTPEQRTKAEDAMVNANQFKGILDDETRMSKVWADLMGKDTDWMNVGGGTAAETEAKIKAQRDEAARWLAEKSIEDNAAADGIKMIKSTRKYIKPKPAKKEKGPSVTDLAREQRYNTYAENADDLVGNSNEIADALTKINPMDNTYSVVDDTYITGLMSDEDYDDYIDANDSEKLKMINKAYESSGYKKDDVVDKKGEKISGLNTAEGVRSALADEGGINLDQQAVYSQKRSQAAVAAYKSVNPKPTGDQKTFKHNGRTYPNPIYIGPGSNETGSNEIPKEQGGGSVVDVASQEEFNAAWAKTPPGGKLKGPNGVVYVKPKKPKK